MACKNCGKKIKSVIMNATRAISRPPIQKTIRLGGIQTVAAIPKGTPLVKSKPASGWGISVSINGVSVAVEGSSANEVIANWRLLEAQNGNAAKWSEEKAWTEANMQWMNSIHPKYHLAPMTLVASSEQPAPVPTSEPKELASTERSHDPEVWGSRAWNYLALILAKDSYDPTEFAAGFKFVVDLLNPNINPSLGCLDCYREASKRMSLLRTSPPMDIVSARHWLVDFHNSVNEKTGKPVLTFEQASKLNFWI